MAAIELSVVDEIIQHASEAVPNEACGILAGKNGRVEKTYKMVNVSDSPDVCYFMDSCEQLKVMKEIRNLKLEMVGIYHSHPGSGPYPSSRDVELAFYPEAVYVIVSLQDIKRPELKAYKIIEGKIMEEVITT
ncbi:MAG: M67 family metallopeptidase [Candidatus Margulisbacteria bacterium]|nr:M67 family metallopeptidase [Candidatus Margulisiibacteriota bacterium]